MQDWIVTLAVFSLFFSICSIAFAAAASYGMYQRLRKNQMVLESLRKDFNVICGTATRASSKTMQLEKQLVKLSERHEMMEMRDPINHSYGQAIAMAKKGMGVDELVSILGLPRGEAELIALMHNVKKAS